MESFMGYKDIIMCLVIRNKSILVMRDEVGEENFYAVGKEFWEDFVGEFLKAAKLIDGLKVWCGSY